MFCHKSVVWSVCRESLEAQFTLCKCATALIQEFAESLGVPLKSTKQPVKEEGHCFYLENIYATKS